MLIILLFSLTSSFFHIIFIVFENRVKVYELDPSHFLSLPGLAWQACLKKTNLKLELLTDYDMLLMVEEELEGEYAIRYIDMQKRITNT